MTLAHLNQKFLESNPLPANPSGVALVRAIREQLFFPDANQVHVEEGLFNWLLTMTDSAPTATTFGTRFVRITGTMENFVDVVEITPNANA